MAVNPSACADSAPVAESCTSAFMNEESVALQRKRNSFPLFNVFKHIKHVHAVTGTLLFGSGCEQAGHEGAGREHPLRGSLNVHMKNNVE